MLLVAYIWRLMGDYVLYLEHERREVNASRELKRMHEVNEIDTKTRDRDRDRGKKTACN